MVGSYLWYVAILESLETVAIAIVKMFPICHETSLDHMFE